MILLSKGCIRKKARMKLLVTSWMRSSTQMIPNLPRLFSIRSLEVMGVRLPSIWASLGSVEEKCNG